MVQQGKVTLWPYKKSLRIQPVVGPWLDIGQVSLFFFFVFIYRDEFKVNKTLEKTLKERQIVIVM